nr:hypothetical protein HmN_000743100 [Hymenolepis microstoma]
MRIRVFICCLAMNSFPSSAAPFKDPIQLAGGITCVICLTDSILKILDTLASIEPDLIFELKLYMTSQNAIPKIDLSE